MDRRRMMILAVGVAAVLSLPGDASAKPWKKRVEFFLKAKTGALDGAKAESALKATEGVLEVSVKTTVLVWANVTYDSRKTGEKKMLAALEKAGYEPAVIEDRGRR